MASHNIQQHKTKVNGTDVLLSRQGAGDDCESITIQNQTTLISPVEEIQKGDSVMPNVTDSPARLSPIEQRLLEDTKKIYLGEQYRLRQASVTFWGAVGILSDTAEAWGNEHGKDAVYLEMQADIEQNAICAQALSDEAEHQYLLADVCALADKAATCGF